MRFFLFFLTISALLISGCTPSNSFKMYGHSMEPTIHENEFMVVDPSAVLKRADIIVFSSPIDEKQLFVKRIIGLPNEIIKLENGKITIINDENPNGFIFDEPYFSIKGENIAKPYSPKLSTFKVPPNGYFVLGDNRTASSDSRTCFILSAAQKDDCFNGKIPFYILKENIKGVIINHF